MLGRIGSTTGAPVRLIEAMRPSDSSARRLAVAGIVVVVMNGGALLVASTVRAARAEAREWREERSGLVGRTEAEIIATFGTPYAAERGPDGKVAFLMYKHVKQGQYCGIAIKDGVATHVSFSFQ